MECRTLGCVCKLFFAHFVCAKALLFPSIWYILLTFQGSSNSLSKEKRETLRKKIVSLTLKKKSKITKVGHIAIAEYSQWTHHDRLEKILLERCLIMGIYKCNVCVVRIKPLYTCKKGVHKRTLDCICRMIHQMFPQYFYDLTWRNNKQTNIYLLLNVGTYDLVTQLSGWYLKCTVCKGTHT